ncbi:MAG: penicillin-insensitive murein endopeptidase [Pseudomonadota bacterium]
MRFSRPGPVGAAALALLFVVVGGVAPSAALAEPAKYAFGAKADPSEHDPAPIGSYAKGCLAGGAELAETGPAWQAMRLSRNRNWGHPEIIAFIARLAADAQAAGWPRLYVGDISQPRGGPMLTGHRSHQIGLDADIWLRRPGDRLLSRSERERISSHKVVAAGGRDVNDYWTDGHHRVIRAAASDPAVARIFVNPAIKVALCQGEAAGTDRSWLRKIRPWWGHDAHFHVRLHCPADARAGGCRDQAPPPPGDGCGRELASWFEPAPPPAPGTPKKRRPAELTLADLPVQCSAVVR